MWGLGDADRTRAFQGGTAMSQENVDLVRSPYESYKRPDPQAELAVPAPPPTEPPTRRDPGAVLARFDPDIDWKTPTSLAWGAHVNGIEAVAQFFQQLQPYMGDRHEVAIDELLDAGDRVVAIVR